MPSGLVRWEAWAGMIGGLLWALFPLATILLSIKDTQPESLAHLAAAVVASRLGGARRPSRRSLRAAGEYRLPPVLPRVSTHVLRQRRGSCFPYIQRF